MEHRQSLPVYSLKKRREKKEEKKEGGQTNAHASKINPLGGVSEGEPWG